MLFDSDLVAAVLIMLVGMAFFTSSMVGHTDNYMDAIKTNILHDKVTYQLKTLVTDGTLETAILLMNNNNADVAEKVIKNRIRFRNYNLTIGNYSINGTNTNEGINTSNFVLVSAVILMNRTEGWYGVYGDDNELKITDKHFISEEDAYNHLKKDIYRSYHYKKAIFYFKNNTPIKVTLKVYGD